MKLFKCPNCSDKYEQLPDLLSHIEDDHGDNIPKDQSVAQYYYMMRTGKTHGNCVVCKRETKWNDVTGKYHRFCGRPICKETYRDTFKKRMIGTYGKVSLLKDPEHQKKMLANRSISGRYKWSDGKEIVYTGSYELDFLKFLDLFMGFSSDDIMAPSPHTYYYKYNGEEKFYMPDFFIPSLNLEIEIKDGGDNPNMHPKNQAVDKVKEKLKDEVLKSQKEFSYIKVVNKQYDNFLNALIEMKKHYTEKGDYAQIFDLADNEGVIVKGPVVESLLADGDEIDEGFVLGMVSGVESAPVLESLLESLNLSDSVRENIENHIGFLKLDKDSLLDEVKSIDNILSLETNHSIDKYLTEKGILKDGHRRPGIVNMELQNVFLDVMESVLTGTIEYDKYTLCGEFKRSLADCETPEFKEVYHRDKQAMCYYFKLLADSLDKERLDIVNMCKYVDDIVTEATVTVQGTEAYPVYVLLTHSGTVLSNAIKFVTKEPYSHASISFDESLEEMYSFGRKYKDNPLIGTFVSESIKKGLYADVQDTASYSLYVTFVTKEQLDSMKERLKYFQEDGVRFKYSFIGLINFKMGKESDSMNSFFCSQFVDHVLSAGKQYFNRHSSLVKPTDFSNHKDFYFVSKGKLTAYDSNKVVKKVNEISRTAKLDNYKKKDKVVYIGLTADDAKKKRLSVYPEGNSRYYSLPTNLIKLEEQLISNNQLGKMSHYTVVPLSKLKHLTDSQDGTVLVELPLDVKVTNVNKL